MLRKAGLRIAYVFLPDLGEEVYGFFTDFLRGEREQAYGLLTDSDRIWERSIRIFYGFLNNVKESRLTDCLRILTGFGRGSLRIFYGVKESRLTDCLRILTGFVRGSLRISYGFFTGLRRAGLRIAYGF